MKRDKYRKYRTNFSWKKFKSDVIFIFGWSAIIALFLWVVISIFG